MKNDESIMFYIGRMRPASNACAARQAKEKKNDIYIYIDE